MAMTDLARPLIALSPNRSSFRFSLPRQQRDPCRARDVGLGISSKLRRHRAPHIMNGRCEAGATLRDAGQLERPEPCAKAEQSCLGGADDQKPRERCVWMTTKSAFPALGAPMSPPWVHGSPASRVYLSLNKASGGCRFGKISGRRPYAFSIDYLDGTDTAKG
jgi:hypothetical protein